MTGRPRTRVHATLALALQAILLTAGAVPVLADAGDPLVDIWYGTDQIFGVPGISQCWVNILGTVSDPDGIQSLVYALNGGPERELRPLYDRYDPGGSPTEFSIGPDTRRLLSPGDFNVEIAVADLLDGLNEVVITATDQSLATAVETVTFEYAADTVWPESLSIDWGTVADIQDVAQVVDGLWAVDSNGLRPTILGYDRTVAIGDISWDDYEVTISITMHGIDPGGYVWPSVSPGFGIALRWPGHTAWDAAQPTWGWEPDGATLWYDAGETTSETLLDLHGDDGLEEFDPLDRVLENDVEYVFKFRVETKPGQGTLYSAKVWEQGTSEPVDWELSGMEGVTDVPHGSCLLVAHHVDLTVGDVAIEPLPDPNPPVISDILVSASATEATVTWKTNEKSTGSVRYGPTDAYEDGEVEDPSLALLHTIVLTDLTPEQWYHYQVAAVDVDSNGAASADLMFFASDDEQPPVIDDIRFATTYASATVTWTTDEPATSVVHCGLTESYGLSVSDPSFTTAHSITLTGLEPETLYHFQVYSEDAGTNPAGSADLTLTTSGGVAPLFDDFESYACGEDPVDWFDTDAGAMTQNDELFAVACLAETNAFGTTSELSNIHSHYIGGCSDVWSDYTYTGRMMVTASSTGIGVTFLSDYPNTDVYYRLRRWSGARSFHVSPHGTTITAGTTDTGVTATAGVWYRFRIEVEDTGSRTEIRARVWADESTEPTAWQVDCYDANPERLSVGTVGVWSMGYGSKYWDDVKVTLSDCNLDDIPDTCEIAAGTSDDCNTNGTPDECEALDDCNTNGTPDECETLDDCNTNGVPDECEVLDDCNSNGTPDECEMLDDCNTNGVPDECEALADCNGTGVPDECETIAAGDFDADGDVDLDDYQALYDCHAGPAAAPAPTGPECVDTCLDAFDFDSDNDVDLSDFAAFQLAFSY